MSFTYAQLSTMQHESDDFCYVAREPEELGLSSWKLGEGVRIGDKRPEKLTLRMSDEYPGIQLTSFIGNSCGMLVVDSAVREVFRRLLSDEEAEFLKVSIINHRGRVASKDYFIINPLGVYDVLNLEQSKIEYEGNDVVSVDEIVLDPVKLAGKPHLIRLKEEPTLYLVSATVVEELGNLDPAATNAALASYPEVPSAKKKK